MTRKLTIEGKISNLDGIMFMRCFNYREGKEYVEAAFYAEATSEVLDRIRSSGIDQSKRSRVTITVEQDEG